MTPAEITRVGVVGCGQMGAGIAEVCATAGLDVVVAEADEASLDRGRLLLERSLARAEARGRVADAVPIRERISLTTDLAALADRQLVIEAVVEDEAAKVQIFRRLDEMLGPDALIASNTSAIPLARLARATSRPENVVGIHFFNPAPVLALVEIVPSLQTSAATIAAATSFVESRLGKTAILSPDRAGFIVNALLIPFILSAIRLVEADVATAEDVDTALVLGAAHPQGPLALADLIGLDTVRAIADSLYLEYKEPTYAPPTLLLRMVDSGRLGRKSGRGFYLYA